MSLRFSIIVHGFPFHYLCRKAQLLVRILVIRFSSFGDVVLTTPVIRCLKQQYKVEVEVHFLVKAPFSETLKANPYIDHLHVINQSVDEKVSELSLLEFDYVIDLQNNLRSLKLRQRLNSRSHHVNKLNIRKWLLVNLKMDLMPAVHIVDRYLDTVQSLGVQNDGQGLDYFIPEDEEVNLDTLPASHQNGYVVWVIGGAHQTKVLPAEKIVEALQQVEVPVLLLGGPKDQEMGDHITKNSGENVWNACGQFSINQSASLVKQAEKVLSNDTGLMHIAAAFKKPIYSFWGNTVPALGMTPYLPEGSVKAVVAEVQGLRCRPCSKIGFERCPKTHFQCMLNQDMAPVVEWMQFN